MHQILRGADIELLGRNDSGPERRSNFGWQSELIQSAADSPVSDIPASPFPAFGMADGCFSSIVEAFVRPVIDVRRNLAHGRAVGSEIVDDETLPRFPLLFHQPVQQAFRCFLIAPTLKKFIKYNAILITCAPQPELTPLDLQNNPVQMPDIARLRFPAEQPTWNGWIKLHNPPTDDFVRDSNPTFQKHLFNLTESEVETTIQPDCMSDDCWRKTVALATDRLCVHMHRWRKP
jgi:hypothetical protein